MPRTMRRPPVRSASWKTKGWRDAPGALPAAGPMPTGAPLPDALRSYRVGVVRTVGRRGGVRYIAYTTRLESLGDYCMHGVSAVSGDEARRVAIAEHRHLCGRPNNVSQAD